METKCIHWTNLLRLLVKHTLWNYHFVLLLHNFSGISWNSEQENISQTIKQRIQFSYLLLYKGIYLFFFWTSLNRRGIPQGLLDKYSNHPVFINMTLIFLLAACANSLVDSFWYKSMSCLLSLIWSNRVWGIWHLIIWSRITVQSSAKDFWSVTF